MTPESRLTAQIQRYFKRLKSAGEPIWWTKLYGGTAMQRAGLPDLAVVYYGRAIWLEVKSPGGKVSKIQEATLQRIWAAGGAACIVRSVEEVRELLDWVKLQNKQGGKNDGPSKNRAIGAVK